MTTTSDHPAIPPAGSATPPIPPGGVAPSGPPSSTPPHGAGGPDTKTPAAGAREARPAAGHHPRETDGQQRTMDSARGEAEGRAEGGAGEPAGSGGGTRPGDDGDPADASKPRTFTIELPAGLKLLSLNHRLHWARKNELTQDIKDATITAVRQAKLPRLQRARIVAVYEPPDRRPRDADNPVASVKACIDGLVVAQVLPDDACPRYVTGIYCTIGEPYPKGRLVLHVTEAEPLDAAA